MVLQLIIVSSDDTETVVAQSGTIHPGKQIEKLDLIKDAVSLSEGTYNGKFNILYYDPDSRENKELAKASTAVPFPAMYLGGAWDDVRPY